MIDKIYEKMKEDEKKSARRYNKSLGIEENDSYKIMPKINFDVVTLLTKTGLLKEDSENIETVEEYYEYLFKLGIDVGITRGKQMVIDHLKENKIDINTIMEIDPETLIKHDLKPSYIGDMIDNFKNE